MVHSLEFIFRVNTKIVLFFFNYFRYKFFVKTTSTYKKHPTEIGVRIFVISKSIWDKRKKSSAYSLPGEKHLEKGRVDEFVQNHLEHKKQVDWTDLQAKCFFKKILLFLGYTRFFYKEPFIRNLHVEGRKTYGTFTIKGQISR